MSDQIHGMTDFGNRREGTTIQEHGATEFILIAIHRSFAPSIPRKAVLNVRFFLPPASSDSERRVWVEAFEREDSFHYYMRSNDTVKWKAGDWNTFESWPTKDVIDPKGLEAQNIGVRVTSQVSGKARVVLPADVFPINTPVKGGAVYSFYLLTGFPLQAIDIAVTNSSGNKMTVPGDGTKSCNKTVDPGCALYAATSLVWFKLDMSTVPEGQYHVQLTGHIPNNLKTTALPIEIYHHP
jgi:hypothetical protein